MNGDKKWYESKGVWGGLVTLVAAGAAIAGYTINDADVEQLTNLATALGAAIGGVLAIWGRVAASKPIK